MSEFYSFLEREIFLFFYLCGKDGEDRTTDLTGVENLTSCPRRHREEEERNFWATNASRVFAVSTLDFHHILSPKTYRSRRRCEDRWDIHVNSQR